MEEAEATAAIDVDRLAISQESVGHQAAEDLAAKAELQAIK